MKFAHLLIPGLALVAGATAANAQEQTQFNVPAGRADVALLELARQAGISIALTGPELGRTRVHGVKGRMPVAAALTLMLRGTGLAFREINRGAFLIVADAGGQTLARAAEPLIQAVPEALAAPVEIVVTASKRETTFDNFAGAVSVVGLSSDSFRQAGPTGTSQLVDNLPMVDSTHLGPGRNKLFIRGVADSSFVGPTQSTVGQYFGDVRLNYNAPDPDLKLFDYARAEVLAGPQGSLYGAGSLGGILKLVPNMPNLDQFGAAISSGFSAVSHGASGTNVAGSVNLPLEENGIGLRLVGYNSIEGGYIDDVGRGLQDINRQKTQGGRILARLVPGEGWVFDLGYLHQDIFSTDGQYSETGRPPYSRSSGIAQPFDNDFGLAFFTATRDWSDLKWVTALGLVNHRLKTRFDATQPGASQPTAFDQNQRIRLLSGETRLSRSQSDGTGWLIGMGAISNDETITRLQGALGSPSQLSGIRNEGVELALFGEWSIGLSHHVVATAGARLNLSALSGQLIDSIAKPENTEPSRTNISAIPSLALTWRPSGKWTVYARYHEGYRSGGLSVSPVGSKTSTTRFQSDRLSSYEGGIRLGDTNRGTVAAGWEISWSKWEHIQADLIDVAGYPFTANIGSGSIFSTTISADWRPTKALLFQLMATYNDSALTEPEPGFTDQADKNLPNIPHLAGRASLSYSRSLAGHLALSTTASLRYFGTSQLGFGPTLDISQGGYLDTALTARLSWHGFGFSASVSNIANASGNTFSFGNPFSAATRRQQTPQIPRTVRVGIDAAF